MNLIRIETDRLILRKFEESDMEAIYSLLSDEEVNTFLPWYPVKDMAEAKSFFEERLRDQKYGFAICLKSDDRFQRVRETNGGLRLRLPHSVSRLVIAP